MGRLPALADRITTRRLDNGLEVVLAEIPRAPLVVTCLWIRAGSKHEPAGRGGLAHFVEHMMFKGSERFGPGDIDRRTHVLGGANNAFTSHDAAVYYFQLAADRWPAALDMEADRMRGLTLDPQQIEAERGVILEEISMVEDDPWDGLEEAVRGALFRDHPYGRPILGSREEVAALDREDLLAFHRRWVRPDNATLVMAGDLGEGALGAVARELGELAPGANAPAPPARPTFPTELLRVDRRKGKTPRLLLALPGPESGHPDHPATKLLSVLLASGRTSRLHRRLVEEARLCTWVSAEVFEGTDAGASLLAAELLPEADVAAVEGMLYAELAALGDRLVSPGELARARRIATAQWVFGHERIHQSALTLGYAASFFDVDFPTRHLGRLLDLEVEELKVAAERWLRPQAGAVLGVSRPEEEPATTGRPS